MYKKTKREMSDRLIESFARTLSDACDLVEIDADQQHRLAIKFAPTVEPTEADEQQADKLQDLTGCPGWHAGFKFPANTAEIQALADRIESEQVWLVSRGFSAGDHGRAWATVTRTLEAVKLLDAVLRRFSTPSGRLNDVIRDALDVMARRYSTQDLETK